MRFTKVTFACYKNDILWQTEGNHMQQPSGACERSTSTCTHRQAGQTLTIYHAVLDPVDRCTVRPQTRPPAAVSFQWRALTTIATIAGELCENMTDCVSGRPGTSTQITAGQILEGGEWTLGFFGPNKSKLFILPDQADRADFSARKKRETTFWANL